MTQKSFLTRLLYNRIWTYWYITCGGQQAAGQASLLLLVRQEEIAVERISTRERMWTHKAWLLYLTLITLQITTAPLLMMITIIILIMMSKQKESNKLKIQAQQGHGTCFFTSHHTPWSSLSLILFLLLFIFHTYITPLIRV